MLRIDTLNAAADRILSAALVGEGLEEALADLALAAQAGGAVIMRNRQHKLVAVLPTKEIAEPVSDFIAGRTPPPSRQTRASHGVERGFTFDHDDYTHAELKKDPYYQEFLRPIGFFWHANARLASDTGEWVSLSFKRRLKLGPYERRDARPLNAILPQLRAATRIAQSLLDAKGSGFAQVLRSRGDPVVELDSWGRVLRVHAEETAEKWPLCILGRRIIAVDRASQSDVDKAVAASVRKPGVVPLRNREGAEFYLQFVPVVGGARDVFLATSSVAVLIPKYHKISLVGIPKELLCSVFRLTSREADVALLLTDGMPLPNLAKQLQIEIGTARNYIKSLFEKTGTQRQSELVALIARLRL